MITNNIIAMIILALLWFITSYRGRRCPHST
jgi:hypothetical protein